MDFGKRQVGTLHSSFVEIHNCSASPVVLEAAEVVGSTDFVVSSPTSEIELEPAATALVEVLFIPSALHEVPLEATLRILSADGSFVAVLLRGQGVESTCPVGIIKVAEGEQVVPHTNLHLIGSQSFSTVGEIASYQWAVQQPPGSQSVFLPSDHTPDPTFDANVTGTYWFSLRVCDDNGQCSGSGACPDALYSVVAAPSTAIRVELNWDTPGDVDQTDEGYGLGTDLDLHFIHPFATGLDVDGNGVPDGWFDNPFDCFWFNPNPGWASSDPYIDDDPHLDRNDGDGAGPESTTLGIPEEGLVYNVGVHVWSDHGFGPSNATVSIFIPEYS